MANTLKFGNGEWYGKKDTILAYNDENYNYKPLPFDFSRDSSATVVNKDGLIETVGNGEPRIDYKDDSKGALLLEPQRTNLITYSEDFSNWSSGSTYTTQGYAISPDGTQNASRLLFTGSGQNIYINTSATGDVVGSIYVKGTLGETIQLFVGGGETQFTLSGDWQRIVVEKTSSTNGFINVNTNGGSTARDLLVWGAQLEEGSYATSYIPTQGSAVTRLADTASGSGNADTFNDSEGTLYFEGSALENGGGSNRFISLSDGTSDNLIYIRIDSTASRFRGFARGSSGSYTLVTVNSIPQTDNNKIALVWDATNFRIWINGSGGDTTTINDLPIGMNTLSLTDPTGSSPFFGKVKQLQVYNTALTDQELQALTQV